MSHGRPGARGPVPGGPVTKTVGIDLGTTFSLVATVADGRPRIIDDQGERLLPSVVGFSGRGELLVGTPARNQYVLEPEKTVKSIKRAMGTDERVTLAGRAYSPQEISAFILRELKRRAERALGEPVERAVITVPASFTDAARRATMDAGEIAGFEVARIINEPTAAALAYGIDREADQKVAVYDLGGGTFDVSIVELSQGVIEVRASHGNTRLGGDDFDQLIADHVADGFQRQHGVDLRQEHRSLARLLRAAEQAKIALSDGPYTRVTEEYIARKVLIPLHLDAELARHEVEDLIRALVRSTLSSVDRALQDAGLRPRDLANVLLVGGSTRIRLVRQMVAQHLGKEPRVEMHPDEAVALGAAVQAAIIDDDPVEAVLVDVAPHALGIETMHVVLDHLLSDRYAVLIPRNTIIPCSKSEAFFTLTPEQDRVRVRVYQGEEPVASRNRALGEFLFEGISAGPPGKSREVIVRFDYDVNGIVQVSALDRRANRSTGITVAPSRDRLGDEEKAQAREHLAETDRGLERQIAALLRRAERSMIRLEAAGQGAVAEEVLSLAGDLERARQERDYEQARVLIEALSDRIYAHEA
ncbi:MAG: Hsp70 family protein [Chloroflexi bacterium]|nr:Hsp70 family protein [Chloroflexota bacterium]